MKRLILTALMFTFPFLVVAGESFIPLQKGVRMASDDLLYNNSVLISRDAQDLSQFKNVDLSILNPKPNDFWTGVESGFNDQEAIAINDGDALTFEGSIDSNSGLYRFNAMEEKSTKIYTIHLDKSLHALLLRKNLLRKLGYSVPSMKYLRNVFINFSSNEELEKFLKKEITDGTDGTSQRWVKNINNLTVELQDVAITEPSETDFYNPAIGVPVQTINSRTLRSLLIPYALVNLYESIESFGWIVGKIDNKAIVLPHFTGNDFYITIEDAQWMLRKINQLKREDFKKIVDDSYFPKAEGAVLLEKIISRRNSLNRIFKENSEPINFDPKITIGDAVKNGKILDKTFPGYASRFAYGDAESPFQELRYFLYSKLQGNVIDNLVTEFNSHLQLKGLDLTKERGKFFQKQFEDGLKHFLQTGEIEPFGVGTWTSAIANFQLIFSRDIIIGNYLGSDNMVQLADTFGASADLGYQLGVEGFGANLAGSLRASTAIVRTFTHLKPVKSLKQSLKEPYKNMFVSLLKHSLNESYLSLAELKNSTEKNEEKAKKIQELFNEINLNLDTGESLLLTDRFMPSTELKVNFNLGLVGAGLGTSGGVTTIRRIQIYKKSPKVLQIYDDHGFVKNVTLNYQFNEYIPVLKVSGKYNDGHYKVKSYMLNMSGDLDKNPSLYSNAQAVYEVLKNRNFELLEKNDPVNLEATFTDKSSNLSLLFFKLKRIKGKTYYDLKAKEGINGKYFSYTKDFLTGFNFEAFSKQIANYYLGKSTNGTSLTVEGDLNPGDSFFGHSSTQNIRFEAEVDEDKTFSRKFLSLTDSKEGWAMTAKKLKKMMNKVNEKFQTILFDVDQIDFEKLRLFKVGYHINLFDRGIERLNSIKREDLDTIEERYLTERGCGSIEDNILHSPKCEDLGAVKLKTKKCQSMDKEEDRAICNVELIDVLFDRLEFKDFKNLIGEKNMYVFGTINGFRQHSEKLNDTIYSHTIGKIGSKNIGGPLDVVRELLGLSGGEFSGAWMRESL